MMCVLATRVLTTSSYRGQFSLVLAIMSARFIAADTERAILFPSASAYAL
jgi:hypothetical protein